VAVEDPNHISGGVGTGGGGAKLGREGGL